MLQQIFASPEKLWRSASGIFEHRRGITSLSIFNTKKIRCLLMGQFDALIYGYNSIDEERVREQSNSLGQQRGGIVWSLCARRFTYWFDFLLPLRAGEVCVHYEFRIFWEYMGDGE